MGYSGAWKNSPAATGGEKERVFQPSNNWGDGVDPRHEEHTGHNQWSDTGFPGPVYPEFHEEVPPFIEDQFDLSRIPPTFANPGLDGEPKGHDGLATAPWGVGDWRAQAANNYAREQDRGMARWAITRHMIGRGVSQTYDSQRTQSFEASKADTAEGGQAGRALRGKNSLAANNPGSAEINGSGNYTRAGWEQHRWTNRFMPRKNITHTKRALHLNLAQTAKPSAAPQGDAYSPYTSPFDGRITSMVPKSQTPMTRREPRAWDEDVTTDGSDQVDDTSTFRSWGL